ncbi:hypothetical protein GQ53DRAFT_746683 [Thozetella sp. PMI_491]|nr:hypothetical protein GQ53DRAFT_746683 [Thozetella sp. PMI_491]
MLGSGIRKGSCLVLYLALPTLAHSVVGGLETPCVPRQEGAVSPGELYEGGHSDLQV